MPHTIGNSESVRGFLWLQPLFAQIFKVYITSAEEFVDVESCVFLYEGSFIVFGLAYNNCQVMACSITVWKKPPKPTAWFYIHCISFTRWKTVTLNQLGDIHIALACSVKGGLSHHFGCRWHSPQNTEEWTELNVLITGLITSPNLNRLIKSILICRSPLAFAKMSLCRPWSGCLELVPWPINWCVKVKGSK